ncbi:hypothetical protein EDC01DRAFT_10284 [Geopyxis carbonaria]|nr:hypothetical protein EDC01DRAFT_10284 [Geopyxis carbonaria]
MVSPVLKSTKLFQPVKIGNMNLKHRVVMAPLTRVRSPEHIPNELVAEYYGQRASDGGLLISEATHISVMGGNYFKAPGIFTPEQRRAWKVVTDAVHAKGGYIYCQLWHIGRCSHPSNTGRTPLGPSANKWEGGVSMFTPTGNVPTIDAAAMTEADIADTIEDYVHAAQTAVAAGFDGVEIHAANGYLLDQFLCDNVNVRTDKYGGSIENRSRLVSEVVDAVAAAIGAERTGIRFSPFSGFQGMEPSDILGQYTHAMGQLDGRGLAYVHVVEPRSDMFVAAEKKIERVRQIAKEQGVENVDDMLTLKPFRAVLKSTPLLACGSHTAETATVPLDDELADAVVFGRYFISNPDLPERLANGWPLTPYNRDTFYTHEKEGYTDYPTYEASEAKL